uniref:Pectin acetylesterase n=1 Tax=Eutreptiella gymnastica TaxID=73025 RepID=A0A7S1JEP6_9EUGL|mmetsp:Transcript_8749/g.15630  ORF Transcript_8749/g.15630 Transcript_8749/m.15630 type:complete len:424 (+) Transcript_8749:90-1361(+)
MGQSQQRLLLICVLMLWICASASKPVVASTNKNGVRTPQAHGTSALLRTPVCHSSKQVLERNATSRGNQSMCSALCNDGTVPVYFARRKDPLKFIVWLQGGGFCDPGRSKVTGCPFHPCQGPRWTSSWTSETYDPTQHHQGKFILRPDGPFAGWSKAFVVYCDGSSFLSNWTAPVTGVDGQGRANITYHLQGHQILLEALNHLLLHRGMRHATDVIFGGTSAGGMATVHNCDIVGDYLTSVSPSLKRYACLVDSGIFLDLPSHHSVVLPILNAGERLGMRACMHHLFNVHQSVALSQPSCNHSRLHECFMPQYRVAKIKYRYFVLQNMYDTWQEKMFGPILCADLDRFTQQVTAIFNPVTHPNGLFVLGCHSHSIPITAHQVVADRFFQWFAHQKVVHVLPPRDDRLCYDRKKGKQKPFCKKK